VDHDADFVAYVDSRRDSLVRAARLLGCMAPEADDLVQTALLRCYRSWDKIRRTASPDAYVYRTLVNSFHTQRKRRWHGELATEAVPDEVTPDFADHSAERTTMSQSLDALSDDHRAVLVLRFYADLSEQQTAAALGIPAGTVKSRVSRALAQLSGLLDPAGSTHDQETP
jgi:RNA polymerase sigma-70 factor (sigma-E family)